MEDDLVELFRLLRERNLRSWSQKNLASARRAASTFRCRRRWRRVGRVDVGDADEAALERCRSRPAGEIFLVHPHGELDQLRRQLEKGIVETSRPAAPDIPSARHFRDQAFVGHDLGRRGRALAAPLRISALRSSGSTMTWQARSFAA